jgi:hypothetical protein
MGEKLMRIRKLAAAILAAAIRRAPPEPRQWGDAMLRELDFVEGDWAALSWSLGSAAAIFRGMDMPLRDPADIPAKMEGFDAAVRSIKFRAGALHFFESAAIAPFLFAFSNTIMGLGVLFIAAACFSDALIQLLQVHKPWRGCAAVACADFPGCLDSLPSRLTLRRDLDVGTRLLYAIGLYIPGWMLFGIGFLLCNAAIARQLQFAPLMLAFPILNLLVHFKLARTYQHFLDELHALRGAGR